MNITQNSLSDCQASEFDDAYIHYDNTDRKLHMTLELFVKKAPHKWMVNGLY